MHAAKRWWNGHKVQSRIYPALHRNKKKKENKNRFWNDGSNIENNLNNSLGFSAKNSAQKLSNISSPKRWGKDIENEMGRGSKISQKSVS